MAVMRYLFAIVLPPLGVFLCAKPISAVLNVFLTLLFYFPGAIHAVLCVHSYEGMLRDRAREKQEERRHKELLLASRQK
jgi:uncharacterized membrane protein YqaE (UPF0057 family)